MQRFSVSDTFKINIFYNDLQVEEEGEVQEAGVLEAGGEVLEVGEEEAQWVEAEGVDEVSVVVVGGEDVSKYEDDVRVLIFVLFVSNDDKTKRFKKCETVT